MGNSAISDRVPVFTSTARSAMTKRPFWGKTLPSARINSSVRGARAPLLPVLDEPEVFRIADTDQDADGVDARHRIQEGGLALSHEVSGRHLSFTDQPLDGRPDRAVAQVQLRLGNRGLGGLDGGLGLLDAALLLDLRRVQGRSARLHVGPGAIQVGGGVVVILLGYGPPLGQGLQSPFVRFGLSQTRQRDVEVGLGGLDSRVVFGIGQIGLRLGELRLGLLELCLVLPLVEREEELVFLYHGPLGEVLRLQNRLHAGTDFNGIHGVRARDELAVDRDRLLDDFRDDDCRRGGRGRLLGFLAFLAPLAAHQRNG